MKQITKPLRGRPPVDNPKLSLTIRVDGALRERLEAMASADGVTLGELVRRILLRAAR